MGQTFWMGFPGNKTGCAGGFADVVLMENNAGSQGTFTLCDQAQHQLAWMSFWPSSIGAVDAIGFRTIELSIYLQNGTTSCQFIANAAFAVNGHTYTFIDGGIGPTVPAGQSKTVTRTFGIPDRARLTAQPSGSYVSSCR